MTEKEFRQQLFLLRCDIEACPMLDTFGAQQRERWAARLGDLLNRRNASTADLQQAGEASSTLKWQPIETAPKDGSVVLVWYPIGDHPSGNHEFATFVRFDGDPPPGEFDGEPYRDGWCNDSDGVYLPVQPTHWMPLPDPPGEAEVSRLTQPPASPAVVPVPEFDYIDGKIEKDKQPRFSQRDLDAATKPLHVQIEKLQGEVSRLTIPKETKEP